MSNMNYLTLELSQATDSKVLSGNSSESKKDGSALFSNLMEQHKAPKQSGNNAAKVGNEEQTQAQSNQHSEKKAGSENNNSASNVTNINGEDTTHADNKKIESQKSDTENLAAEAKNSSDADLYTQAQLSKAEAAEAKKESSAELLLVSTSESDNASLFTNPEQLLSFLNASEKVLSGKERTSSEDAEKNPVTPVTPVTSGEKSKTGTDDSVILNKVNELLKSKASESTNTLVKNGDESVKLENAKTDASSDQQKLADITKLAGANGVSGASSVSGDAAKDDVTTDKLASVAQNDLAAKANQQSVIDKANNGVQLSDEATDVESDKAISLVSASEAAKNEKNITTEQVVAQLKPQASEPQLNKDVTKVDGKTTALNNAQEVAKSLAESTSESVESEQLNTVKSDVKENQLNSINQAAFKTEQVSAKSKDSVQAVVADSASSKVLDSSGEVSDEVAATELAKDELLTAEVKSANSSLNNSTNSAKPNQAINPLFDTLSQREVNDAVDGERYMQDEHSFDNVMQTLSADLAQTQKNTVIQQAETISIMRKDFTDAVKDKVMVMISQKIQQIDIQLDPPELGSMQVRINMQNEQAVVSFVVQNQQAKEALEQNMDRLKQMMADNGVDVGDANVKQDSNQSAMNGQGNQGSGGQGENGEDGSLEGAMNSEHAKVLKASSTGVDYYV
ncbi:flagellar hook-length control protein FliK [Pseudocolwellia sp. HL-MZ19]|uniref:flagellar hook-length control protein FliK n=1 Tax=unclassified Pseudocolwellia TaxID=2848178 RepID=UPI003CF50BF9